MNESSFQTSNKKIGKRSGRKDRPEEQTTRYPLLGGACRRKVIPIWTPHSLVSQPTFASREPLCRASFSPEVALCVTSLASMVSGRPRSSVGRGGRVISAILILSHDRDMCAFRAVAVCRHTSRQDRDDQRRTPRRAGGQLHRSACRQGCVLCFCCCLLPSA